MSVNRSIWRVLAALVFAIVIGRPAAATEATPFRVHANFRITIGTARPVGNYFAAGNAICRLLHRASVSAPASEAASACTAPATEGSVANIEGLKSGTYEVAIVQSDWHHHAFKGIKRFEGRAMSGLRSLLSLHREPFQLLSSRNANIRSWPELQRRVVNYGGPAAPHRAIFDELLKAHGKDAGFFGRAADVSTNDHFHELCEGNIDALGVASGVPNSAITGATRRCGAVIADLDTPEINRLVAATSYLTPVTIPRSAYPGMTRDVRSFAMLATLVTTADLPEATAYALVRVVFEGLAELKQMNRAFADLVPERMITDGLTAPLHPGAERYYRERGWLIEAPEASPHSLDLPQPATSPVTTVTPTTQPSARRRR